MHNDNIIITNTTQQSENNQNNDWQKFFSFTVTNPSKTSDNLGAAVKLDIKYSGKNSFKLYNILYQITYTLQDNDGRILPTFKKVPVLLVNKAGDIDEKTDFDFTIKAIQKNNKDIDDIHQEVNSPQIIFTKNSTVSYLLNIVPQQNGTAEPLPQGNYKIEICFSLVPVNKTKYAPLTNLCNTFDIGFNK